MTAGRELCFLCFALRMNKNTLLPTALCEIPDTVEALDDAFRLHYLAIGKPLTATSQLLELLLLGYFHADEATKKITCVLDTKDENTELNFEYAEILDAVV